MLSMANIVEWLENELRKREWNQSDLARHANISRSAVSNLLSGKRYVGKDIALAIAKAFNIPVDVVLRAAGDLPQVADTSSRAKHVNHLLDQLPDDEVDGTIEYLLMRLKMRGVKVAKKKTAHADGQGNK